MCRDRHELDGHPGDQADGALGAGDGLGHVGTEVVEAVAGDLPGETSELGGDELLIGRVQVAELRVDGRVIATVGGDGDLAPVGEHEGDVHQVLGGGAVGDGVGAAGVVGDHASDGAAGVGGGVRPVGQAEGGGGIA